ncbi:adhesion G protein-coupled receptor L3 [Nephila pilipes]|uniref:Adhesion G protein-coupled receptor L3 n=1 Tax=Nephila pilipes TaxID=299642 RepID=A0A8X6PCT7_NEPPI|nr:adhesion G protein-coupled receptor L3 [Nephila pilipes]
MDTTKRCILLYFFFGQLISGVNHEKEKSNLLKTSVFSHKNNDSVSHLLKLQKKHSPTSNNSGVSMCIPGLNKPNCVSSISESLCSPYDSCISRCGEQPRGLPFTCNCDPECSFYSDCCVDIEKECGSNATPNKEDFTNVTCELLFQNYPVFMVSSCSPQWKNDSLEKLCNSEVTPECAFSNFQSNSTDFEDTFVRCEKYVHRRCAEQLGLKCNETIEPYCGKLIKNHCSKVAASKCKNCEKEFWPVFDKNKILYKNSFCALCNYENNFTSPNIQEVAEEIDDFGHSDRNSTAYSSKITRICFPSVIDSCPDNGNSDLYLMCEKTSGVVVSQETNTAYKNVYCALCHNESLSELRCVNFPSLLSNRSAAPILMAGMIKQFITDFEVTGITNDIQGLRLDDIPATFSMLLNFGLDGRQRVYISSEGDDAMKEHQRRCGKGKIWNPFSAICRKLHCSTQFVLIDYQCVKKDSYDEGNTTTDNITVPYTEADFVHLTFSAEMELFDFLHFHKRNISEICDSIRESFSTSFNITIDRIRNVSFNISLGDFKTLNETLEFLTVMDEYHQINFTIDLDLYEPNSDNSTEPEPSVDSIVSLLASALSVNGFDLGISNTTSRIYEIYQTVDLIKSWCKPEEGFEQKQYWNSDFRLILNDNITSTVGERIQGIYINKTDKFYPKGHFVANILYQGHQFNQNLINVSGVAIVCEWKVQLNKSCTRVVLEKHEYLITENGSLDIMNGSIDKNVVDDSKYEEGENDSIVVCILAPKWKNDNNDYYIEMDVVQAYLSFILSWISVCAMIAVLATYSFFSSLRNLPGCNTMNLTVSLLAMQVTFLLGQRNTVTGKACKAVACLLHYEILCCFMWMNIMAYDLYKTFGNKSILNNIRSKGKYLVWYMVYAYGCPLLIIITTSLLDHFLDDSTFSPHYGKNNVCWITNKSAAVIFFAVPLAIIMCVNFTFYILTICSIRNVKHISYLSNQKNNQRGKSDVFLYARMASVVGLTWTLAFVAAYTREDRLTGKILTYLFLIFNTLQGVFIFCVFVCNRRVFGLYRDAIRKSVSKMSDNSASKKTSESFHRIMNVIHRSVSTDTVVSTISSSSTCSTRSGDSGLKTIEEAE